MSRGTRIGLGIVAAAVAASIAWIRPDSIGHDRRSPRRPIARPDGVRTGQRAVHRRQHRRADPRRRDQRRRARHRRDQPRRARRKGRAGPRRHARQTCRSTTSPCTRRRRTSISPSLADRAPSAVPVLLRVTRNAQRPIEEVPLTNVKFSTAPIANAPADNPSARRNPRTSTITDIAYADGQVWVAGLSNEEFASSFRRFSFPFGKTMETTTLEIYHVSHRASETRSPVTSFTIQQIGGKTVRRRGIHVHADRRVCVADLVPGKHVVGRTVAELGAGNTPTDLVPFKRDGKDVIMVVNNRRPLMRIDASDVATGTALTVPEVAGIAQSDARAAVGHHADGRAGREPRRGRAARRQRSRSQVDREVGLVGVIPSAARGDRQYEVIVAGPATRHAR